MQIINKQSIIRIENSFIWEKLRLLPKSVVSTKEESALEKHGFQHLFISCWNKEQTSNVTGKHSLKVSKDTDCSGGQTWGMTGTVFLPCSCAMLHPGCQCIRKHPGWGLCTSTAWRFRWRITAVWNRPHSPAAAQPWGGHKGGCHTGLQGMEGG